MFLSLTLLSVAAAMDLKNFRVSNRLIAAGLTAGFFLQMLEFGGRGAGVFLVNVSLPIILFYLLFLMRVLGAGDIKLFSMIGGIWDLKMLFATIISSFFVAAAMSLFKVLYHHNFIARLQVFREYAYRTLEAGKLLQYPRESRERQHIIHFSMAILIGFAIAMEVSR